MPKARFYLTLRAGHVQIRSSHTNEVAFKHSATPQGIATAIRKCWRLNNSYDVITYNIINHLKSLNKQRDIPEDFYPVSDSVETEWRM